MRIDAHQHYWKIDRNDYGWITPEIPVLYRDYLPSDLEPHLQKHGISHTIVVQAAPTVEETEYILELSKHADSIAGVIGWLDLESPLFKTQYRQLCEHPKFTGIRVMIQEMDNPGILLSTPYIEALSYLAEEDLPVDLLVLADQLPQLIELLERVPGLRGVIDHLAKPPIASDRLEPWRTQMAEIAQHPGIYCKLSGMVTEAHPQGWTHEDFTVYVHEMLDLFGPERLLFGSDWPVCLQAATYDEVMDILRIALQDRLSPQEMEPIFGANAARFYKLNSQYIGG
ncbi:amidohydrolase family protein [Paenibacillus tianjinensis]|uniref:Amidohydrolase family protein n=1 Tax=Paenibacillus tianjinensis TaxID=2810347 RepID=A0ABX7LDP5_9BACL|nr:amidohydrolase family protein [Paenibacillus tianjinensis]QSF46245.1 amidohydrolase family protein [Paenibacillus tianjinensis]